MAENDHFGFRPRLDVIKRERTRTSLRRVVKYTRVRPSWGVQGGYAGGDVREVVSPQTAYGFLDAKFATLLGSAETFGPNCRT